MINIERSIVVPAEYCGLRIDVVLAKIMPEYSRSQLTTWLKSGNIKINSQLIKPKEKVIGGELVEISIPPEDKTEAVAENIPLDIIFEDEHLMVVNKPAGLVVHPGAANYDHTLVNALLFHDNALSALPRAGIIHRLDKETTGLLLIGKTLDSYTALTRLMQNREIQRRYLALVQGHIISGGEINTFFGRHPRSRIKMAVCKQGKEAITHYYINEQFGDYTLLDVQLLTGRTHQIRVHMAHINHPVVGDPLYGNRLKLPAKASENLITHLRQFKRQALHAASLSFVHPITDELLTLECPIPDDFQQLLTTLEHEVDSIC